MQKELEEEGQRLFEMSYPHMPNYYRTPSDAQHPQQGYIRTPDATSNANVYQDQTRRSEDNTQGQYVPATYDWSNQGQSALSANSQNTYVNNSWQNRASNSGSQNYQRSYYAAPEQAATVSQNYQSRDPYNSQNTQGLNNLAYVSEFESAAAASVKTLNSTNSAGQNNMNVSSGRYDRVLPAYSQTPAPSVPRFKQSHHHIESPSVPPRDLALDAAAALADAMSAKYPQESSDPNSTRIIEASQSTNVRPVQATAQNPTHRTSSQSKENNRPKSRQSRPNAGQGRPNIPASHVQSRQQSITATALVPTPPATVTPNHQPPSKTQSRSQLSTQNPTSISNLVTAPDKDEGEVCGSVEQQQQMPHYIDPSQVFNPYHREHERKKKEAADAEERRKVEDRRLAEEKRKLVERNAFATSVEPAVTANSKSATTKKSNVTAPGVDAPSSTSQEEAMAAELKNMMSKMKEFKSSNPSLFQKLWNDMRGGGSGAAVAASMPTATDTQQTPPPKVTQASIRKDSATTEKPGSKPPEKLLDPSPIPRNGFKIVVENNPEGLPDLGRFPAERRIRQSYAKNKSEQGSGAQQSESPLPPTGADQTSKSISMIYQGEQDTVWPEPRRRAVAISAIHFLKSNPENADLKLSAQEICSLLERNPSYVDLCSAIESRGFKFQKSAFARELLRSVPELQSSASRGSARISQEINTVSSVETRPSSPPPILTPGQGPQQLLATQTGSPTLDQASNSSTNVATVEPNQSQAVQRAELIFYGPNGLKNEASTITPKQSKASQPKQLTSARVEPPLGSKEAAARKRDFADLIDLTNLDDDENYVMPRKVPRISTDPTPDPFQNMAQGPQAGFNQNIAPLRFDPQPQFQSQSQSQSQLQARPQIYPGQPAAIPFKNVTPFIPGDPAGLTLLAPNPLTTGIKPRVSLAKKIQTSEALQKAYYDPKTVARDILIASGRHLTERPLNAHLAALLGLYIEMESDLSTLEWDGIDPEGPHVPKVEFVDLPVFPPKHRLGERVVRRKRRSAADTTEKTQKPKEASASALPYRSPHTAPPSKTTPPPLLGTTDLPGIDSDRKSKRAKIQHEREREAGDGKESTPRDIPTNRKISIELPVHQSQQSSRSVSFSQDPKNMQVAPTPPKKRGRPFGSKNKNTSVAALKEQAQAIVARAIDTPPEPVLHSYKCKWVKCNADLHNLDTLKRHIWKKHRSSTAEYRDIGFACWWKKCRYLAEDEDKKIVPTNTFHDDEDWYDHIISEHIAPIAEKYGDGPKTNHTGKHMDLSRFRYDPNAGPVTRISSHADPQSVEQARTRYLSDEFDRLTTPPVTSDGNLDFPSDAMVLTEVHPGIKDDKAKADTAAQNAFMKARGSKAGDARRVAEEVVRAMEVRKQKIGPGIDRGGCTLINDAQRSTFIQSPGISRVVDIGY